MLDRKRLGKQRVESKQVLLACLAAPGKYGWQSHPATKMWKSYEHSLCTYSIAVCEEWRSRGYNDSLLPYFTRIRKALTPREPHWLGGDIHSSHRSVLLYKAIWQDSDDSIYWYAQFGWSEEPELDYFWPVS